MQLGSAIYRPRSPADAIRSGVFLCPRDRGNNAVIPDFNLTRNITLPFLSRYSTLAWINRRLERQRSSELIEESGVVCQSIEDSIGTLWWQPAEGCRCPLAGRGCKRSHTR